MVVTCGARVRRESTAGKAQSPERTDRSGRVGSHARRCRLNPDPAGLWVRLLVRALVVAAAGVMALGFFGPGAALLVCALTVLTFVLLWLRGRPRRRPLPDR